MDFSEVIKEVELKRIYVSGAITGNEGYKEEFAAAERFARQELGCGVINPAAVADKLTESTGLMSHSEYMHVCYAMLDLCDAILLIPGWEESKGALTEYGYALGKKMLVIECSADDLSSVS